jgi:hypothetical protein
MFIQNKFVGWCNEQVLTDACFFVLCARRSVSGFMHMKIVANQDGRYILGQFSQPFFSIAQMVHYYTVNKLPIKGAEHISLSYPVKHEFL